jgi:hypothetical protein
LAKLAVLYGFEIGLVAVAAVTVCEGGFPVAEAVKRLAILDGVPVGQ